MKSIQTRLALVAVTLFTAVVVPRSLADDRKAKVAGAARGPRRL